MPRLPAAYRSDANNPQRTSTSLAGCKMHYLPADSSSGTGWTGTECYSIN